MAFQLSITIPSFSRKSIKSDRSDPADFRYLPIQSERNLEKNQAVKGKSRC